MARSLIIHAFNFGLLWAYQVPLGASVRADAPELVLVQIADPQLGMLNMYNKPTDWSKEERMLQVLAEKAVAMKPELPDMTDVFFLGAAGKCFFLVRSISLGNLEFGNIAGV